MTYDTKSVEVICVTLPKDHCVQVPWKYIKVCGYSNPFLQKTWTKWHWPLDDFKPHLFRSHVWLYPRIIVCKSHGNTSMYVDTVINFAKYHIHTTYGHTYYVQNEWSHSLWIKFRRDKKQNSVHNIIHPDPIQIHPTGYVCLILHSTSVATASWSMPLRTLWGYSNAILARNYRAWSSCCVPSKVPRLPVATSAVVCYMRPSSESGGIWMCTCKIVLTLKN